MMPTGLGMLGSASRKNRALRPQPLGKGASGIMGLDQKGAAMPKAMRTSDQSTPSFSAFVFDLDGTLLDTLPDLIVITNTALRACGYPERTANEIKSFVGNGVQALMYQAIPSDAGTEAAERAMARWRSIHPELEGRLTRPYPGIEDTIGHLRARGAKTAVLSNKFDEGVQQVIGEFMPDLFDVKHGECERIPRKPDPTGLLLTLEELGVAPQAAAYVGDSPGDIEAARRAGVFSIGVTWGYHGAAELADAGADALIERADELLRFASSRPCPAL